MPRISTIFRWIRRVLGVVQDAQAAGDVRIKELPIIEKGIDIADEILNKKAQ